MNALLRLPIPRCLAWLFSRPSSAWLLLLLLAGSAPLAADQLWLNESFDEYAAVSIPIDSLDYGIGFNGPWSLTSQGVAFPKIAMLASGGLDGVSTEQHLELDQGIAQGRTFSIGAASAGNIVYYGFYLQILPSGAVDLTISPDSTNSTHSIQITAHQLPIPAEPDLQERRGLPAAVYQQHPGGHDRAPHRTHARGQFGGQRDHRPDHLKRRDEAAAIPLSIPLTGTFNFDTITLTTDFSGPAFSFDDFRAGASPWR